MGFTVSLVAVYRNPTRDYRPTPLPQQSRPPLQIHQYFSRRSAWHHAIGELKQDRSAVSQYRVVSLACDLQEPVRASVDAFFIN
jgi:hypothetical protein